MATPEPYPPIQAEDEILQFTPRIWGIGYRFGMTSQRSVEIVLGPFGPGGEKWPAFVVTVMESLDPEGQEIEALRAAFQLALDTHDAGHRDPTPVDLDILRALPLFPRTMSEREVAQGHGLSLAEASKRLEFLHSAGLTGRGFGDNPARPHWQLRNPQ